ncbi:hypothetical protein [Noviherbaspirillum aridicola]|uniref:Uncharacterized protein n=1 Tax=Noviherbaspirillum aridicola TaxID=2849687 RepID=A0ABQ4Q5V0_9BURK|nr:hypothetical protein [Noviherbaspirillum aridicola]GIZ52591.1 hypothetical protein NCCP691_26050 [Noviherbaspirillum aridicola]
MNKPSTIFTAARAAILMLAAGAAWAQTPAAQDAAELAARYPKGSIDSVEAADKALEEVARVRGAINARFEQEEQACLPKFFATSCIDKAKDKQREDLKRLRPIELESNTIKRQARVEKRDADLADRQEKAEAKRQEAEAMPPAAPRQPKLAAPEKSAPAGRPQTTEERVAEHEARLRAREAKEQAEAPERAARAAAYERKVQASKARQEEVARRKAEKEAKRRAREEAGESASPAAVVRP